MTVGNVYKFVYLIMGVQLTKSLLLYSQKSLINLNLHTIFIKNTISLLKQRFQVSITYHFQLMLVNVMRYL